ncbi:SWI/SNF-related matrix-associated actin-dependent regulator of chromatin subfamily B member 1-A [Porphyridium purpureum]|uniref:SWI/SNF-related matrix-associated actin-dependent regulator of chromatin subfamily B member 1-A n=1 Tax=Porphyridium purpureum TaxID=35688 RepID=A0A5J4YIF4_PORPP|nr:SWI/SNF-related matrix-associated actin-dependent regulator of chromatin subfamily B member 1-A [Porphyridium purpureum]|eukprot:POR5509..scf251_18
MGEVGRGQVVDDLVPIRLDITVDGVRYVDAFSWGFEGDDRVTPEAFAKLLVRDENLSDAFGPRIALAIKQQLHDFVPFDFDRAQELVSGAGGRLGAAITNHAGAAKKGRGDPDTLHDAGASDTQLDQLALPRQENVQVVSIDLRMGRIILRDQFEWDILNHENCPESFATQLCADLGLPSEYVSNMACGLREQLYSLRFSPDGLRHSTYARDLDTTGVLRSLADTANWQPTVECLSKEDVERVERREIREARLNRRNRGRSDFDASPRFLAAGLGGTDSIAARMAGLRRPTPGDSDPDEPSSSRRSRKRRH